MAIKIADTGLETKIGSTGDTKRVSIDELIIEDIEDGDYNAELVIVYPWKTVTHDSSVKVKDEEGRYVKDEDGNFIKEEVKDLSWSITDIVFKILDYPYENYGIKATLSTHPDMIGSAKKFLYNADLFDVSLKELYKNTGCKVKLVVKNRETAKTYRDKKTGALKSEPLSYVSYYKKFEETEKEFGI